MNYNYKHNKKQMIKDLIYLQKNKLKFKYFDENNKIAFKEIEKSVFDAIDKLNLSFKAQNTIFYIIGDYCENKPYNTYENEIIKKCLEIL